MEKLLKEFAAYDEKTKGVIVDHIIQTHEKFFIALKYAHIPSNVLCPKYDADETVARIEENIDDVSNILAECKSPTFLNNIKELASVRHPLLAKYRFIKPRDFNQYCNTTHIAAFLYPKCRLWLFFKYRQLWCMVKNRDIEMKKKIREFFHSELRQRLNDDHLYVLEVCYETRRTDDVTGYHVLDVYEYGGECLVTKPFEYRYNFLCSLKNFDVLPVITAPRDNDKYLLKRKADNAYNRTESTLILSRLKMDQYYLLVGETQSNDKTRVYVAKLDPIYDKFNIIGCTTKNKNLLNKNIDFTDKGVCIFGSEYTWKCTPAVDINYYKKPIAAKLMIMSSKLNMRSSIKEILEIPPNDRALYVKF